MMKKTMYLTGLLTLSTALFASAQTSLYTTYEDFSGATVGWNTNLILSANNTFSTDASTVNGLGNSSAPGGAGTSGSLLIGAGVSGWTDVGGVGYVGNLAGVSAMDPGYANNGVAVAAAGNIYLDYSLPGKTTGGYFQIGVLLAYPGNSYWGPTFSSSTTDLGFADPNGQEVYRATIPYSIAAGGAGSLWGIGLSIMANTDYAGTTSFYVDNISVSAAPVPEPGTMALAAMGGAALLFFRRRAVR
jgi:hypothetical protein